MFSNVRNSFTPSFRWVGIFRASSQLQRAKNCRVLADATVSSTDQSNASQLRRVGRSNFSQGRSAVSMDLNYQDIVEMLASPSMIFIDVREPGELKESGSIPGTVNIPLGELKDALQLPELQFLNKYGITRPSPDNTVVFHCRSGNRSKKAMAIAKELGFMNVKHYAGGYMDWVKNKRS